MGNTIETPNSEDFETVCFEGDMKTIKLMIKQKKVNSHTDWNNGFKGACRGNRIDIAELMLSKGASSTSCTETFRIVCSNGYADIVKLIIKHADKTSTHNIFYSKGLEHACKEGHMDVINMLMDSGETRFGLDGACKAGRLDIVKLMVSRGVDSFVGPYFYAQEEGHYDISNFFLENGVIRNIFVYKKHLRYHMINITLFRTILYQKYTKKTLIQRDLIPELFNLIFFNFLNDLVQIYDGDAIILHG